MHKPKAGNNSEVGPRILSQSFYGRDTLVVARELLGKIIVVRNRTGISGGRIIETEAYREDDPASHSYRGETPRSSVMFGEPGLAYVYFIYGMYEMLNFVTEKKGTSGAVLIRALEPMFGIEQMIR
ncbi:MAG: DNA-3-methyladenine glycosylase, partial [Bdellovibrionota bacterium]